VPDGIAAGAIASGEDIAVEGFASGDIEGASAVGFEEQPAILASPRKLMLNKLTAVWLKLMLYSFANS
jgi:hypothetical protein